MAFMSWTLGAQGVYMIIVARALCWSRMTWRIRSIA